MTATPDPFQAEPEPPGRNSRLSLHRTRFVTEGPFDNPGGVLVWSTLADFPDHPVRPHGIPDCDVSYVACFRVANALATWRQAKVCLRPLSCYGQDRASRPPPLQHRVPILSSIQPLDAIFADVSLAGLLRDLFRNRLGLS
jgi:hypothetical protein